MSSVAAAAVAAAAGSTPQGKDDDPNFHSFQDDSGDNTSVDTPVDKDQKPEVSAPVDTSAEPEAGSEPDAAASTDGGTKKLGSRGVSAVSTGVLLFAMLALGGVFLYMRKKHSGLGKGAMVKAASITKGFLRLKVCMCPPPSRDEQEGYRQDRCLYVGIIYCLFLNCL